MAAAAGLLQPRAAPWLASRRELTQALSTWVLTLVLVLFLAFDNGGFAITAYAQVGIAVWWIIAVCAAWILLPVTRPSGTARGVVLLFAGFTAWTALGITWSISDGRSFEDLALISCYLGILVLAVQIHRERGEALRRTLSAVATAIVIVAVASVASRLWPHLFSGSQTADAITGNPGDAAARLAWPIGYWNALAALMAIGLPLLLGLATSARTLRVRSAAAAAVPVLALCAALTQSRGALVEAAVGVVVFIALAPQRATKLLICVITGCGSALLVAYGLHQHAVKYNLAGGSHSHQAWMVALATVVLCACVGLAHAGADRAMHGVALPRLLSPTLREARIALGVGVVLIIIVGLAAHGPAHISHSWDSFKSAYSVDPANHFSASGGEGRYQFWAAGIDSAKSHPFTGSGPGTFQLDWLPRATIAAYTVNAHSLYVETYTELGLVGFLLLAAFLVTVMVALIRQVIRSHGAERVRPAAIAAALAAFLMAAGIDWVWQLPAIVAVVLLLIGAGVAPRHTVVLQKPQDSGGTRYALRWPIRIAVVLVSLACIFAAAYPLATNHAITSSQNAAGAGNVAAAITDASDAVAIEPSSAAAQLQLALSLEADKQYGKAISAARAATRAEPQGWENWYVLWRLYTEAGRDTAAGSAYARARSSNPQSSLFQS